MNPLQERILSIFLEFEKVCVQHNLQFYLSAGTLLGAIRHKGFIPWDDDMDVVMPRKDYELLIKHSDEWFSYPYELDCKEKTDNYPLRFAKVYDASTTMYSKKSPNYVGGVFVDIFPLDGLPDGKMRQKFHVWKCRKLDRLLYFSIRDPFKHGKRFDSYLVLFLQKLISSNSIYRKMKKIATKYDFETSEYITDHEFGLRGIFKKEALGNIPAKVVFEGHETFGIAHWDYYLTTIYGNYMQLPPPEKRKTHHFTAYLDMNLPYREYKIKK